MLKIMKEQLGPDVVNLIGITQVCPWNNGDTVKQFMDVKIKTAELSDIVRTTEVGPKDGKTLGWASKLDLLDRNEQIIHAIRTLLTEKGVRS
jgi:hypothetical protein